LYRQERRGDLVSPVIAAGIAIDHADNPTAPVNG
jgi:hypothetical protein